MTEPTRISRLLDTALVLASAVLLAWPAGPAAAQTGRGTRSPGGDFIVAVVNTELVTAVEVAQRLERASAEARRSGSALVLTDALRQQALDTLIDERVQVTFAREAGQKVDDAEIDRAVANIAAQNQLTVAQLRERLKAEGMEYARFRGNLRDQIQVERVREREVNSRIRISDSDVDAWIADFRRKAAGEVQLNIAQILVTVPDGASDAVVAERRARAEAALARVRAGEDFAKVATELSEDGRREAGGEIGLKPADRLPDLFVESVKALKPGQFTAQPVRSGAGFHVLKLIEQREGDAFKISQTHARHILVRISDREQTDSAVRRMADLRRQIDSGSRRFEVVAREVSEDGSAEQGGDLGWTSPGGFVPEFEEAMDKLPPGGLSAPVVSRFGVHLIQVLERRDIVPSEREIRDQARNRLREQKYEQAYLDWVKELRLRAYVEMREPPL